jgi:hypothetical protein
MIRHNFAENANRTDLRALIRTGGRQRPAIAIGTLLIGFGVLWGAEDLRLAQIVTGTNAQIAQRDLLDAQRGEIDVIRSQTTSLSQVQASVAAWRAAGVMEAEYLDRIATTLDRLALSVTSAQRTPTGWTLRGAARDESEVGHAILALRKIPHVLHVNFASAARGVADRSNPNPPVEFALAIDDDTPPAGAQGSTTGTGLGAAAAAAGRSNEGAAAQAAQAAENGATPSPAPSGGSPQ